MEMHIKGGVVLIDEEDFGLVNSYHWWVVAVGNVRYAQGTVSGKKEYMHRLLAGVSSGVLVDHKNRNGLDNRRENLRACTRAQNLWNKKRPSTNTSGLKGATFEARRKKWVARIWVAGKAHHLGYFLTKEEAHAAYVDAGKRLHGEFARAE